MTSFEFVFGLISVITSLALTNMLGGAVSLYRHAERVQLSWRHGLWVAIAFMVLIANWAAFWKSHDQRLWSALDILIPLAFVSVLYAFCDLVMPDKTAEHAVVNLREYHLRKGGRYKTLQLAFAIMALILIAHREHTLAHWFGASKFAILAALIGALALRARSTWLDTATAIVLALLGIVFMIANLQLLSA
ncbi:hypothetical protein [Rhodanobacter sp. L36]|uniref:hypothetical protein n=1 Tax=Rhodanobacter sp. L36 TaxID=1747221 RepID=UPI00131D5D1A|nr:hypothetical protein [Rhodanobacter sp. L36]